MSDSLPEESEPRKNPFSKLSAFFKDPDRPEEISKNFFARIFALIGIYIPPKRKGKIIIGKNFGKVLLILPFVFLLFLIAFFEYSTSPQFCNSCHIMAPYYKAWKTSKHNHVACVECHYPPGTLNVLRGKFQAMSQVVKYITKTYSSKPYAEISDKSCLREGCHSKRLLEGKVEFKKGIHFDHTPHLTQMRRGKKLRCTSCHSQIVVGNHIEVTEDTCFLCHFKDTKEGRIEDPIGGCPLCHRAPQSDIKIGSYTYNHKHFTEELHVPCQKCHLDAIKGEGKAPKDKCLDCHGEPWKLKYYEDTQFVHKNHVTERKVECNRCHEPIEHKLQKTQTLTLETRCDLCHEHMHAPQRDLFIGHGGKGSPGIPSHMYTVKVDCTACHISPDEDGAGREFHGLTYKATEKACTSCHGEQYQGMIDDWKKTFDKMLSEIEEKDRHVSQVIKAGGHKKKDLENAKALMEDARYNINMVRAGRGVHNPFYAAELLQVANRNFEDACKTLGKLPPAISKNELIYGKYCAALCHQKTGTKLPVTASYRGVTFPHKRHAEDLAPGCTSCHSPVTHKKLQESGIFCSTCHHKLDRPGSPKCGVCHPAETGLFNGNLPGITDSVMSPNPHKKVMECAGCHDLGEKSTRFSVIQKCILCHDATFRTLADKIRDEDIEHRKTLEELKASLREKLKDPDSEKQKTGIEELLSKIEKDEKAVGDATSIHNVVFFMEIYSKNIEKANDLLKE